MYAPLLYPHNWCWPSSRISVTSLTLLRTPFSFSPSSSHCHSTTCITSTLPPSLHPSLSPPLSLPPFLPPSLPPQVAASLLEPLVTLIPCQQSYALISILVIAAYQFSLSSLGLTDYLVHGAGVGGARSGLLDANREGVVSCVGYVALYLGSVQIGRFTFKSRYVCVLRAVL